MGSNMGLGSYDGSRSEPPYHTDSDTVVDLNEQIDSLESALYSTQSQLAQAREERDAAHEEIRLSRESEGRVYADLLATREELERVRGNACNLLDDVIDDDAGDGMNSQEIALWRIRELRAAIQADTTKGVPT